MKLQKKKKKNRKSLFSKTLERQETEAEKKILNSCVDQFSIGVSDELAFFSSNFLTSETQFGASFSIYLFRRRSAV
jgi:hypothetical protein